MKVGINLLLWTGNPSEEHLPLFNQIAKWGFDGVEVPIHPYNENIYKAFRARMDDLGLGATATTVMPMEANPISEDPSVRAAGIQHLKRALEMCAILKCDVLAGPMYSPVGRIVGRARNDSEWGWAAEALAAAGQTAEAVGVDMAVEALNRFETYFLNTLADACALAKKVGHPRVKVMIDSFHANIEEKDLFKAYKSCGKLLAHCHVSENDRGVPGTGHVDWKTYFSAIKTIKYDRWFVIESFSSTVPEIASAASIWRAVSPSKQAVAKGGLAFVRKSWAKARAR
jgi:D-psicose/D-tagatose/L-ribulose 3-epimerase